MIETILGINPAAIGGAIVAVMVFISGIFLRGVKAGKDSEKAKDAKANEQTLKDLAKANSARAGANTDKLHDDGFRRD